MTAAEIVDHLDEVEYVPLRMLKPAKDNPRSDLGDLDELAASIAAVGVVQPLVATRRAGKLIIVAGHRRHAAAIIAGLDTVPVIVRDYSEADRQEAMLVENLQRRDLSPFEEAAGFAALVKLGQSQRQIAERVGRTQPHVSKRLRLLDLPKKARKKVEDGSLPLEDAVQLAALAAHPKEFDRVLEQISSPYSGPTKFHVERALAEIEWAATRVELEKHFAEQQTPMFDDLATQEAGRSTYLRLKDGHAPVAKKWHNGLGLNVAKHETEPCSGYAISKDGHAVAICTDPARHGKAEKKKPEISKEEQHRRDLEKAGKGRRAAAEVAVSTPTEATDEASWALLESTVAVLVEASWASTVKLACKFLGVAAPSDQFAAAAVLTEHAAGGRERLAGVARALYAANREDRGFHSYSTWGPHEVSYVQWLQDTAGYEPPPAERTQLSKASNR